MIKVNGYKFAENKAEIVDSLFKSGGTVSGRIKRYKRKIVFYDLQDNIIAALNSENVCGTATKQDDGTVWYCYMVPYFLEGLGFLESHHETRELSLYSDDKGLVFK